MAITKAMAPTTATTRTTAGVGLNAVAFVVLAWALLSIDAFAPRPVSPHHASHITKPPQASAPSSPFSSMAGTCTRRHSHDGVQVDEVSAPFSSSLVQDYWGHSPLLIRKAFTAEEMKNDIPCWSDVMELAIDNCSNGDAEEDFPTSRIIQHIPSQLDSFQLDLGPFDSNDEILPVDEFNQVVQTLVVNDVDRFITSLSDWMDANFGFLPRWRRDDAQISLARKGGGIGPHVDSYDVFLIQTSGRRTWQVGEKISTRREYESLVEASQVRVLDLGDVPMVEFELDVGDCLYLPPRVLHQGIAVTNDCATLSVGGRAPSASELVSRVAEFVASSTSEAATKFYTDEWLVREYERNSSSGSGDEVNTSNATSLSGTVKDRMKELVRNAVEEVLSNDSAWDDIVGRLATEAKRPTDVRFPTSLGDLDDEWRMELDVWGNTDTTISAVLNGQGALFRTEGLSCAWSHVSEGTSSGGDEYRLFSSGEVHDLVIRNAADDDDDRERNSDENSIKIGKMVDQIANGGPLDQAALLACGINEASLQSFPEVADFLKQLVFDGVLYGSAI